jgi:hypothetical protein
MVNAFSKNLILPISAVLLIVALLISLLLPYNKVHAWSGNIPTCSSLSLPLEIEQEVQYFFENYPDSSKSYVIWNSGSNTFFTGAIDSNKLEFTGTSTQQIRLLNDYTNQYVWSASTTPPDSGGSTDKARAGYINNLGYWEETPPSNSQKYQNYTISTAVCIQSVNNVVYNSAYTGNKYEGTALDLTKDPTTNCNSFDVACYISTVFEYTVDTFKSVAQSIVTGIAYLFIPKTDLILQAIADFQVQITDQLGFLVFPIEFAVDMVDAFNDYAGYEELCIPPLFGSDTTCFTRISENQIIQTFLPYLVLIMQTLIVTALLSAWYTKYRSIINGN